MIIKRIKIRRIWRLSSFWMNSAHSRNPVLNYMSQYREFSWFRWVPRNFRGVGKSTGMVWWHWDRMRTQYFPFPIHSKLIKHTYRLLGRPACEKSGPIYTTVDSKKRRVITSIISAIRKMINCKAATNFQIFKRCTLCFKKPDPWNFLL